MASGIQSAGVDLDDLFDPDTVGDGPTAPGVQSRGVPLRYAALKYGSKRANVGIANAGSDVSNLWAAKGTAKYNLPVDGTGYQAIQFGVNGSAQLIFQFRSDGTYAVVRSIRGATSTLASGTWLPAGDAAANYTCSFTGAPRNVQMSGDAGFNNITNAATASALTTTRQYTADAQTFTEPGAVARQIVDVTCNYYRAGVLVHAVHVTFDTQATS